MEGQRRNARIVSWLTCVLLFLATTPAFALQEQASEERKAEATAEPPTAEEETTPSDDAQLLEVRTISTPVVPDSPLVKAAKANRAREKPRIVITDDDVRKSRGNLIEVGGTLGAASRSKEQEAESAAAPEASQPPPMSPERRAELVAAYEEQIDKKTKAIAELEKELQGLEEDFYIEDDPAIRDQIDQRFVEAQKALEDARKSLEETQTTYDEFQRRPN